MPDKRLFEIGGVTIARGQTQDIRLKLSETYTGDATAIPIRVIRGPKPGPVVFVTAAIHGNEINGTGIIHDLMYGGTVQLRCGTVLLVPVVNIFGFETHTRYMPDGRDLNRSFPGSNDGSLSRRVARTLFDEIVRRSDLGIDLHSAGETRTNFPNIRGDLSDPRVRRLAKSFGSELMVHGKGPDGSLRREACAAGCPTVILEAGEPLKVEAAVLNVGVRGVQNVLIDLGMMYGQPTEPVFQTRIDKTLWIRAQSGGILRFHLAPGDLVEVDQPVATNISVFGEEQHVVTSPHAGIVLGMTTMPTVKPGEPICHVAVPRLSLATIRRQITRAPDASLHRRARDDLATSIFISEPTNGQQNA